MCPTPISLVGRSGVSVFVLLLLQDKREYYCWDYNAEEDKNNKSNSVGTISTGRLDATTARDIMPCSQSLLS